MPTAMTEKQLLTIRKQIEEGKQALNQLKGKKEHLMETLQQTFGCSTLEEAASKLKAMRASLKTIEAQLEQGCAELGEKYGFE